MPRQATNQAKKKKQKRKSTEEYCSYLIEILNAKVRYSISENRGRKLSPGPYSEYSALEIIGRVVEPLKIAGREIDCTIYGSRDQDIRLNHPEKYDDDRYALIGNINARKDYCGFTGWVPASVLLPVGQLILAKELRYFDLMGKPLYRNYANIHHMSIIKETEADPDQE